MFQEYENKEQNNKNFIPLSKEEEHIGKAIVNAAYIVHKDLGPGLLEKVYEVCFCHVLTKSGFLVERQKVIPIIFDGIEFKEGLRLDVMINNLVICELKA